MKIMMLILKGSGIFKTRDGVKKCDIATDKIIRRVIVNKNICADGYKWMWSSYKVNTSLRENWMRTKIFKANSDFKFDCLSGVN